MRARRPRSRRSFSHPSCSSRGRLSHPSYSSRGRLLPLLLLLQGARGGLLGRRPCRCGRAVSASWPFVVLRVSSWKTLFSVAATPSRADAPRRVRGRPARTTLAKVHPSSRPSSTGNGATILLGPSPCDSRRRGGPLPYRGETERPPTQRMRARARPGSGGRLARTTLAKAHPSPRPSSTGNGATIPLRPSPGRCRRPCDRVPRVTEKLSGHPTQRMRAGRPRSRRGRLSHHSCPAPVAPLPPRGSGAHPATFAAQNPAIFNAQNPAIFDAH